MAHSHLSRSLFSDGFTIVEILVVIVIIAILATLTTITYNGVIAQATDTNVKTATSQAAKEIFSFETKSTTGDIYPTTSNSLSVCQSTTVLCDYYRTDYTDVESGEVVKGFNLTVCSTKGDVQYTVSNIFTTPKINQVPPKIDNTYSGFTGSNVVRNIYAPIGTFGTIYGYTGNTTTFSVPLTKCTIPASTTIQWRYRVNSSASWVDIPNANNLNYTTPILDSSYNNREYIVSLTNSYGTTNSLRAIVIMDFEP